MPTVHYVWQSSTFVMSYIVYAVHIVGSVSILENAFDTDEDTFFFAEGSIDLGLPSNFLWCRWHCSRAAPEMRARFLGRRVIESMKVEE